MKINKMFLYGAAVAALGFSLDAHAETYDVKQSDSTLSSARYIEPEPAPQQKTVVLVEPAAGDMHDFTGPYIGAAFGYTIGTSDVGAAGLDGNVGLDGMEGGVFLGYGFSHNFLNDWLGGYAGIEFGYDWGGADGDFAGNSFEKGDSFLVTLRPGLTVNQDAVAYGIIGYSRTKFETDNSDEGADGMILGAGAEFDTHSPVKVRLEYSYTNFQEVELDEIDFEEHENTVKLGVVFRF